MVLVLVTWLVVTHPSQLGQAISSTEAFMEAHPVAASVVVLAGAFLLVAPSLLVAAVAVAASLLLIVAIRGG
jgi:hypothetical protein